MRMTKLPMHKARWIAAPFLLALALCAYGQQGGPSIHVDGNGFLRTQTGKPWTRVVTSQKASDSEFAFLELAFECDAESKQVFADEARLVLLHKSGVMPASDMPAPTVTSDVAKGDVDDWMVWRGNAKLQIGSPQQNQREIVIPQRDFVAPLGAPKDVNASALRLNALPGRPRVVSVSVGGSRAIAAAAGAQVIEKLGFKGWPDAITFAYVSMSGREISANVDSSRLLRAAAIALHKHCGTP